MTLCRPHTGVCIHSEDNSTCTSLADAQSNGHISQGTLGQLDEDINRQGATAGACGDHYGLYCAHPQSYVKALTPSIVRAHQEVIKVIGCHKAKALIQ